MKDSSLVTLTFRLSTSERVDEPKSGTERRIPGVGERICVQDKPDAIRERERRVHGGSLLPQFHQPRRAVLDDNYVCVSVQVH